MNVEIVGDSMLSGLNEKGMSKNNNVKKRNHGPCTSEDIMKRVESTIRRNPEVIIFHVGTNDIISEVDTISNMENVIRCVRRKLPDTKIAISSVIARKDKSNIEKDVSRVNYLLYAICLDYSLDYISNENIEESSLGSKKVFLNKKGNSFLAVNYMKYLDGIS